MVTKRSRTREFAEAVGQWSFDQFPLSVVDRAKQILLDGTGAALAATSPKYPIGGILKRFVEDVGGASQAQVYGSPLRTNVENAALVNGTLAYHIDNEPHHAGAIMHPVAIVAPAVLAVGEHLKSSGAEVLTALIAGVDVACRLSYALDGPTLYARGFHPSAVAGTFGSAAATALLRGLKGDALASAYGLAGTQASGLLAWVSDDKELARPFNIGIAARNGVVASHLAACGFSGPPMIFEGKYPLSAAFSGKWDESALFEGLGVDYKIMELYFKLYACVSFTHPGLDGLLDILSTESLTIEQIDSITLRFPSKGYKVIDGNVLRSHCAQYLLALAARTGTVDFYAVLNDARETDAELASLSERVTVIGDVLLDETYPDWYRSIIEVRTRDGITHTRDVTHPKGSPRNPISQLEVNEKFRRLTSDVLSAQRQDAIIAMVADLETVRDIGVFCDLLSSDR